MTVPDQDALAWDLLDAVRRALDIPAINRVAITMATGDYPAVIEMLLAAAAQSAVPVPAELCARLDEWAQYYSAHPSAARLRQLADEINRDTTR